MSMIVLSLALLVVAAPAAAMPPIISEGCQGERCGADNSWIVKKPLPLFDRPGGIRRIGTIRRGTRVTVLNRRIVTSRIGTGVTVNDEPQLPAGPPGLSLVRLPKGTRIRTLYYEGEGIVVALAPNGQKIGIDQDSYRVITRFRAFDWLRLRTPYGRSGWIKGEDSACLGDIRRIRRACL